LEGENVMNQLKFFHNYLKLPPNWQGKKATLLFVREIELEEQTAWFIKYDTQFWIEENNTVRVGNYPLPKKGKYLLLLLECEGTIFTTLRSKWGYKGATKQLYYEHRIGEEFYLVRTEEEKK
jgi:hypothetical protein